MPEVNHKAVGLRCWIGETSHPVARQYRQQPGTITAVWRFGSVVMASVRLDNGETIQGLFLYELQNAEGESLRYKR